MQIKPIYKKGLTFYPTKNLSREQWLNFRKPYLGGSDMGTIMGINENMSQTELFYQKLGIVSSSFDTNPFIHWGHELEPVILKNGQHLDVETQQHIGNPKLRRLSPFPYMINNPEVPWLLANVDALENFRRNRWTATGIGEAKNISRQAAEKWETIPPYHFFQTQAYQRVLRPMLTKQRALLLYLKDGHELYGYYIEESPELCDDMLERSFNFHKKVLAGQDILNNTNSEHKRLQFLAEIEPSPDHTKAWEKFWSELYKKKVKYVRIEGSDELFDVVMNYIEINKKLKELEQSKQLFKNQILKSLKDESADVITFGEVGRVTYNKKLYVKVKK